MFRESLRQPEALPPLCRAGRSVPSGVHKCMEPNWAVQGCADVNSAYSGAGVTGAVCALRSRRSQSATVRIRPDLACICADQNRTGEVSFYEGRKRQVTQDDQVVEGQEDKMDVVNESEQAGDDMNGPAEPTGGASTA